MNAKVISAPLAPGQADTPPPNQPAASQVAMVVMLVPIPAPSAGSPPVPAEPAPPSYVDEHDHVWLLVDRASPMAAVFQQITTAEPLAGRANDHPAADPLLSAAAHPEIGVPGAELLSRREIDVLLLLADGRSNQEIAQSLILALSTIKMGSGGVSNDMVSWS